MKILATMCCAALLVTSSIIQAAQDDGPNVKRAGTGFCYERGSPGYRDTLSYKAFDSLQACVDAGGRLPNKTGWSWIGKKSEAAATSVEDKPASQPFNKKLFDTRDSSIVKQTRDGICLDANNPQYQETHDYAGYRNLKDCLDDGGHSP
jgi:hypothetical protein